MKLSIVIVNYNSGDDLGRCLASLEQASSTDAFEIVVVDNQSTDGSAEGVKKRQARVLSLGENAGFASAANFGIESTRGDLVLLLNPDVVLSNGTIEKMVSAMQTDPSIGALGPRIREHSGGEQASLHPFPANGRLLREALFLDRIFEPVPPRIGWLQGCCLLLRRQALDEIGAFDSSFFLYYEDVDLCYRFRKTDWKTALAPGCEVIHDSGARDSRYGVAKLRWYHESLLGFYRKHYPRDSIPSLRRILILRSVIRLGLWASLYLVAPRRREERGERVRGYAAVLGYLLNGSGNGSDGRST